MRNTSCRPEHQSIAGCGLHGTFVVVNVLRDRVGRESFRFDALLDLVRLREGLALGNSYPVRLCLAGAMLPSRWAKARFPVSLTVSGIR